MAYRPAEPARSQPRPPFAVALRQGLAAAALTLAACGAAAAARPFQVQSPDPVIDRWRWRSFDSADGLIGPVYDLHEGADGTVWIATSRGAQSFDGYRWRTYTAADGLASDSVIAVTRTSDGSVWLGHGNGHLSRLNAGGWQIYKPNPPSAFQGISFCETDGDGLWVGFHGQGQGLNRPYGLFRFQDDTFYHVHVPGADRALVADLHQAGDGSIWVATFGDGLFRYRNGSWQRYHRDSGEIGDQIGDILEGRDGVMWFAGGDGSYLHVTRFDGQRWERVEGDSLKARSIWPLDLWETPDGTVWGGTHGGRLCRIGRGGWVEYFGYEIPAKGPLQGRPTAGGVVWVFGRGHRRLFRLDLNRGWQAYTHAGGLHGGAEAADGSVWFHTGREAVRLADGTWTAYGPADGFLDGRVASLHRLADGSVWFLGTHRGQWALCRRRGQAWSIHPVPADVLSAPTLRDPVPANFVEPLLRTADGDLWLAGTLNGRAAVGRFDGAAWSRHVLGDASGWVGELAQASDGSVWAGCIEGNTGHGLYRYDGETWQRFPLGAGPHAEYVTGLAEWPRGTLWAGTMAGISRLDLASLSRAPSWTHKLDFGMDLPKVRSLCAMEDGLWLAFLPNRGGGAVFYDGEHWRDARAAGGLAVDGVSHIVAAHDGGVWFVGQDGLGRLSRPDEGEHWLSITAADGLEIGWLYPYIREARDGSIWIDDSKNSVIHFRFRRDDLRPETRFELAPERLPADGALQLRWSAIDGWKDTAPEAMRYQWRLDAASWSPWSERTELTYTGLKPGRHRFEVRAMDGDAYVDPEPAVLDFRVDHPWWRNPWVVAVTVVLVAIAAVQSFRVVRRDRRLARQNEALTAERARLEEQTVELAAARDAADEASRAKSRFLANMSHEIRTPMNVVLGYAQILQRSDDLPPDHRRAVEAIRRGGDHLLKLINDVLDISKIEAGRMEVSLEDFDLSRLLRDLAEMFALQCQGKGLAWRLVGVPGPPRLVRGDAAKLRQILINLLGNAVRYTASGSVTLSLEALAGDRYRFAVADTGPGIAAAELESLLQPFTQGASLQDEGGTGLGLTIAARLLDLMDSRLQVRSTVDEGSTFSFELQLAPAAGQSLDTGTDTFDDVVALAPGVAVRALVVDDRADNRAVLRAFLEGIGVRVEEASDGARALEMMAASPPDIAFVDVRMPGMDGLEMVRRARRTPSFASIPVIATSASVLEHERQEFLAAGFDDFIDKPFHLGKICACLARRLGVEFERRQPASPAPEPDVDWKTVRVPPQMHGPMREAAELYSVTELERYCRELDGLGPDQQRLARRLRDLSRRHDMQAIIDALEEVQVG